MIAFACGVCEQREAVVDTITTGVLQCRCVPCALNFLHQGDYTAVLLCPIFRAGLAGLR
jgi:hypothetical protein